MFRSQRSHQQLFFVAPWLAAIAMLILPSVSALAAEYHVAPADGACSDAGPGSASQPWCTLEQATEVLEAGDTAWLHGGVYAEQLITIRGGSASAGSIVFAAAPGQQPVIDGTGVTTGNNGVLVGHDYIKLLGLEIRNWNDNGVWVEGAGFLEISDCVVHDVTYGIGLFDGAHDFVLDRVEIYAFDLYGFDASYESTPCYNGTLNDCVAHGARDPDQNVDGFALGHGAQHDFVLNRCVTYDVYDGFDISARSTTLNRCAAYACGNACYKIWQDDVTVVNSLGWNSGNAVVELDWDGEPGTTTLRNCTFFDATTFTIWVENAGDSLHMTNCIIAGGDNIGLAFEQLGVDNYVGNHNVFHNGNSARVIVVGYEDEFTAAQVAAGAWATYSGQDDHSLLEEDVAALFVDPSGYDLHLLEDAVAVDAGTSVSAPTEDYDGDPRPQGSGWDIGAYEYGGGQQPTYPYVYFLELAAHQQGSFGSLWVTDVVAFNEAAGDADLELVLHAGAGDISTTASVVGGAQGVFADVVGLLVLEGKGVLEVRSSEPLRAAARTYNMATTGTFGQAFALYTRDDGLSAGESAWLLQLRQQSNTFRTNIAVANTGSVDAEVRVRLRSTDGSELHVYTLRVEAATVVQDIEPFARRANRPDLGWGFARVEVVSGTGVLVSASVVDSRTNDATTVVMRR